MHLSGLMVRETSLVCDCFRESFGLVLRVERNRPDDHQGN